jgi:hypothetical protein
MSRRDCWLFVADRQEAITKIALDLDTMTVTGAATTPIPRCPRAIPTNWLATG